MDFNPTPIADYRGKAFKIVWSGHTLNSAVPLDDARAWPELRPGSTSRRVVSGIEDAWTTGIDWLLSGEVIHIQATDTTLQNGQPHSGWDGTGGWRAFLEWAWDGHAFVFYPDASDASTAFNAVLVEPTQEQAPELDAPSITRRLALVIRRSDGDRVVGYNPAWRVRVYAPRSVNDAAESLLLVPASGAPHGDAFAIASMEGVTGTGTLLGAEEATTIAYQPYLDIVTGRKAKLDPLERSTDLGQLSLLLLDKRLEATLNNESNLTRWFTGFIGDADGKNALFGCRVEVDEYIQGVWTRYFTGRVADVELEDALTARLEVADLSEDMDCDVFVGGLPHASVHSWAWPQPCVPLGVPVDYGDFEAVDYFVGYESNVHDGASSGLFVSAKRARSASVTQAFVDLADSRGITPGDDLWPWPTLFFNGGQVAAVLSDGTTLPVTEVYLHGASDATDQHYRVLGCWSPEIGEYLSASPAQDWRLISTAPPTEAFPMMIGDVHLAVLWKALLDGKFGYLDQDTGAVLRSFTVDTARFAAMAADDTLPVLRMPVPGKGKLLDWIEENICKPHSMGWRLDPDGTYVPLDLRLGGPAALSTATAISDSELVLAEDAVRWTSTARDAVTRVKSNYYVDQFYSTDEENNKGEFPSINNCFFKTATIPFQDVDNSGRAQDIGDKPTDIEVLSARVCANVHGQITGIRDVIQYLTRVTTELRAPFKSGSTYITIKVIRQFAEGIVDIGTFLTLNISKQPNQSTNLRGGERLALCVSKQDDGAVSTLEMLDLGAIAQPDAPLLDNLRLSTSTPTSVALVDVTPNALNMPVAIEIAITDVAVGTAPAETSALWTPAHYISNRIFVNTVGPYTATIFALPPGMRVWVRGRSVPGGTDGYAVPSVWVAADPDHIDMASLGSATGFTVTPTSATTADAAWTNPATAYMSSLILLREGATVSSLSFPRDVYTLVPKGSTTYQFAGLKPGTSYAAAICYLGASGGDFTTIVGDTFTQPAAGTDVPRMAGIWAGLPPNTQPPPTGDTGVIVSLFPSDTRFGMEVQRAADDGTGDEPDVGTAVSLDADIAGTEQTYFDPLALDGVQRWYRARHISGLEWTCWRKATPTRVPVPVVRVPPVLPTYRETKFSVLGLGTLILVITDTQCRITLVEYKTQVGNGAESAYSTITGVPFVGGGGATYGLSVPLAEEGSSITYKVTGYDTDGVERVLVERTVVFAGGAGLPPGLATISFSINQQTGSVDMTVVGTSASLSHKYLVSTSAFPAEATVLASGTVLDGRVATTNIGTLAPGQRFYVTLVSYDGASGTGSPGASVEAMTDVFAATDGTGLVGHLEFLFGDGANAINDATEPPQVLITEFDWDFTGWIILDALGTGTGGIVVKVEKGAVPTDGSAPTYAEATSSGQRPTLATQASAYLDTLTNPAGQRQSRGKTAWKATVLSISGGSGAPRLVALALTGVRA